MSRNEKRASLASGTYEDDALPLPVPNRRVQQHHVSFWRVMLSMAVMAICFFHLFSPIHIFRSWRASSDKVNIILMISDGYGPASETFGRSFHQALHNHTSADAHYKTPLDELLIGSHRSRSSDSLITDSAAGATAFACGLKSYNGAIGVDAEGQLCATVLEGAKEKGFLTGVVVTSRLTDATPASFFAHVPSRAQEDAIASEALGLTSNGTQYRSAPLDLAIGGGGCYFLPRSSPHSCRADEQNLVDVSLEKGWHTRILFRTDESSTVGFEPFHAPSYSQYSASSNITAFDEFFEESVEGEEELPLLALLAPFNTPYEIDRPTSSPPLYKLALKALNVLDRSPSNKKGFFVMIEGSQIDLCAHSNDPACHAREIAAYQEAIEKVTRWVDEKNKNGKGEKTILISTSDHETGGLTLGRQLTASYPNYAYYPQRLIPVRRSAASLSAHLLAYARTPPVPKKEEDIKAYIRHEILGAHGAGFLAQNGGEPSPEEVGYVFDCLSLTTTPPPPARRITPPPINTADVCRTRIADLISRRTEVGWSTSGHTGVDVPVHGRGPSIDELRGNIENTDIGTFMARQLDVDLDQLTKRLQKNRP